MPWNRDLGASLLGLTLLAASCSTPEERKSPAQIVRESSNLLQQLGSYADAEQREGISRIRRLGREQGSAVALYILDDPTFNEYRVEVVLARILADWKQPRAIGHLLRNLNVPDEGAVRIASEGLLAFGDNNEVIAALEEMLARPSDRERRIAADVLKRIPSSKVLDIFHARWKAETDREVRGAFLVSFINSRHPMRKELLVNALTDADLGIRTLAWEALKKYPELPRIDYAPDGALETRAKDVAVLRLWLKAPGKK